MSRSALLCILVEIRDGDVIALRVDQRDPAVAAHPAAGGDPLPLLRFPKANVLRAAVAELVTAARRETHPCTH